MNPDDRFQVKNENIEFALKEMADQLACAVPEGWGFAVQLFDFKSDGEPGSLFYISNAKREDMIATLKEFIQKNENGELGNGRNNSGR